MSFIPSSFFDKFQQLSYFKEQEKKQHRKIFIFSAIAGFIGAITALLFSPKSGKENRKYIADQGKKAGKAIKDSEYKAEEKFGEIKQYLEEKLEDVKEKIEEKRPSKKDEEKPSKTPTKKSGTKKTSSEKK